MAQEVASAFVGLIPSARGFGKALSSQIDGDVEKAGKTSGSRLSEGIKGAVGDGLKGVSEDLTKEVGKGAEAAGTDGGAKMGGGLRDGLKSRLASLKQSITGAVSPAAEGAGKDGGSRLGGALKSGVGAAAAGLGGILLGALALDQVKAAFSDALDVSTARAKLAGQLALTAQESARYGAVAGKVYSGNYGDSIDSVNETLRGVVNNITGTTKTSSADLQSFSTKTLNLVSTFGADSASVTAAAGQLIKTGLAKNGTDAFNIITAGFQQGVDKSGDFLDTINEYGTQFRKVGIDGQTMTGILSQGLKAGARDADLVADSIKEFSIRAVDGSTQTASGFKDLGLNAKQMAADIAAGGPRANAALDTTLDRLRGIKDPVQRSQTAVKLFGTQAEDLGAALYAIDPSTAVKGLGDVSNAAGNLDKTLGSTPAATIEKFKRSMQTGVVNFLGGTVIPGIGKAASGIQTSLQSMFNSDGFAKVKTTLSDVGSTIQTTLGPAFSQIGDIFTTKVLPIAGDIVSFAGKVIQGVAPIAKFLVTGVFGALVTVFQGVLNIIKGVLNIIVGIFDVFIAIFTGDWSRAWDGIKEILTGAWQIIVGIIQIAWGLIKDIFTSAVAVLWAVVKGAWAIITALFSSAWTGITSLVSVAWNGIKALFSGAWTAIQSGVTTAWNAIKAAFATALAAVGTAVSGGLNSVKTFFSSAWTSIQTTVRNAWTTLKSYVSNGITNVKTTVTNGFNAIKGIVDTAWTSATTAVSTGVTNAVAKAKELPGKITSGLGNMATLLYTAGSQVVSGFVSGIRDFIGNAATEAANLASSVLNAAKAALGIHSPSRKFAEIGKFVGLGFIKGVQGTQSQMSAQMKGLMTRLNAAGATGLARWANNYGRYMTAAIARRDDVVKRLAAQRSLLADLQKQASDYSANVVQGVIGAGTVTGVGTSFEQIVNSLTRVVDNAKSFSSVLAGLKSAGLNKTAMDQLIQAGPSQGLAAAQAILAEGSAGIQQINALQASLASTAKGIGATAADAMYGNGIRAAQGLIKGLESQRVAVANALGRMAATMVKTIKKSLGIHSPSRVFQGLGEFTVMGLAKGLQATAPAERAVGALSDRVQSAFQAAHAASRAPIAGADEQAAAWGAAASSRPIVVQSILDGRVVAESTSRAWSREFAYGRS